MTGQYSTRQFTANRIADAMCSLLHSVAASSFGLDDRADRCGTCLPKGLERPPINGKALGGSE
jgi:hypothetical protein